MDRRRHSAYMSSGEKKPVDPSKDKRGHGRGDGSSSSSHTHFYRKPPHEERFGSTTRTRFEDPSESLSESGSFGCVHPGGRKYTPSAQLKRNLVKELDPQPTAEAAWTSSCAPAAGLEMAEKLSFLVQDPAAATYCDRIDGHLADFGKTSENGYNIAILDSVCVIIDYLVENTHRHCKYKEHLETLLRNAGQPVLLNVAVDVITNFDQLRDFMAFLGYLLMRVEDDSHFKLISSAVLWHLNAADGSRGRDSVRLQATLAAAAPVLHQVTARMLAVANENRFDTFLQIALILACDSADNCIELIKENILENIFCRFNPLFPDKPLPDFQMHPLDVHDMNLKIGDSSKHLETTITLLFVLLKTAKTYIEEDPSRRKGLPCPDFYSQRCFCWAYALTCRAHRGHRVSLTVVATTLLWCFGSRLQAFSAHLMPDVMSLSVQSEVPRRSDWTALVTINTSLLDVQFKKTLIYLSVDLLKAFPCNSFMVESTRWLLGLMYLLDPELCTLRPAWPLPLFQELRKVSLQALVCVLPIVPQRLVLQYSLIRRILWYIEWYSVSPYELPLLYWSLRLLQTAVAWRRPPTAAVAPAEAYAEHRAALGDLFDTHGLIIIMHMCETLLEQKKPPIERSQAIISVALMLVTSAAALDRKVTCLVYPEVRWPSCVVGMARRMMDVVMYSLHSHFIISDRWLIALLNFIWQTIIWRREYRETFVANNGVFRLLDIVSMSRAPVQCLALALVCEVARAGNAVAQLVTWRATLEASISHAKLVKRGASIACLLASVFRDDCRLAGVESSENGVISGTTNPIMSKEAREQMSRPDPLTEKSHRTPTCYAAADLAGSRMSKVFALLQMLSEDLQEKVALADEAYHLYKNVKLSEQDEVTLVLCSHFLSLKLGEAWAEAAKGSDRLLPQDQAALEEFNQISRVWVLEVKSQQEKIVEKHKNKEQEEESSLYTFLARVRLNTALDALREVRCEQRAGNRRHLTHEMLHDAVHAHQRRAALTHDPPLLKTYVAPLDEQNMIGQNVKVASITRKDQPEVSRTPSVIS